MDQKEIRLFATEDNEIDFALIKDICKQITNYKVSCGPSQEDFFKFRKYSRWLQSQNESVRKQGLDQLVEIVRNTNPDVIILDYYQSRSPSRSERNGVELYRMLQKEIVLPKAFVYFGISFKRVQEDRDAILCRIYDYHLTNQIVDVFPKDYIGPEGSVDEKDVILFQDTIEKCLK